jgi:leucyl/phenylalanyl-tRNA--protein transferase
VEVWEGDALVGGLYGVSLGGVFFGESMFARVSNASKVAFVHLVRGLRRAGFSLIDCQVTTAHLMRFGSREIPRSRFMKELQQALQRPTWQGRWRFSDAEGIALDEEMGRDGAECADL